MEITELTLWIARLSVLGLMYFFLLLVVWAVFADARAAARPERSPAQPAPLPVTSPVSAPTLIVTGGAAPANGRAFPLVGPLEIGRDASCGICIPNRFVSKVHLRVYVVNGVWMVEDLGSTNGSQLNGAPLHGVQPLNKGDRLVVGDTEFLLS